jgi:hypothetical protein
MPRFAGGCEIPPDARESIKCRCKHMSWLDDPNLSAWSFGTASFACEVSGAKWDGWFEATAIVDIKPVLDATTRYIDVGGVHFGALTRECAFVDAASRDAFLGMVGQTKTLNNDAGRSRSCVLTAARYINAAGPFYYASATWEAL